MSSRPAPRNAPRIGCSAPIEPLDPLDPLDGTAYRTVRWVGRGGMGEVVEAEHRRLGKRVVVKLLGDGHGHRRDLVDRLRLEAQTLARLDHPNLVAVHDLARTPAGRAFLVMERLEGRTLGAELRRRGALPWVEAVDIACQLLDALEVAHRAGVVHRDVKLDNAFRCATAERRPRVKLLDFGIAKVLSPVAAGLLPVRFRTDDEVAVGTPRCFSPEQALGNRVDARTDVYGAAVLLYALLAGRGPFDHLLDARALARAHATETPAPPSRWAARALPRELETALLRALAKQPAHRPPSAAAFARALRAIAATHGRPIPPLPVARPAGAAARGLGRPPAAPSAALPGGRLGRARRVALLCLVILVASLASALAGAGVARLQAHGARDFSERSPAVVSMDPGASKAAGKGASR